MMTPNISGGREHNIAVFAIVETIGSDVGTDTSHTRVGRE